MRRIRWLLLGVGSVVLAGIILGLASRRCEVVVYNESAETRAGIMIAGGEFTWRVPALDPGQSRRQSVPTDLAGVAWVVHTGRAAEGSAESWFEPGPGRRLIVRVWPDGSVDFDPIAAWWE